MGPPKRGPRAQGPIFARSMEIGAPPMRHLSFIGEPQERVLPFAGVLPCGVLPCGVLLLRACSFAATQECAEGSRHDATDKMGWDSPGRPTAEPSF